MLKEGDRVMLMQVYNFRIDSIHNIGTVARCDGFNEYGQQILAVRIPVLGHTLNLLDAHVLHLPYPKEA